MDTYHTPRHRRGQYHPFETDTSTENESTSEDHSEVDSASLQGSADSIENTRHDNRHATTEILIGRRENQSTSHSTERHTSVNKTVLGSVQAQVVGEVEVGTTNQRLVETRKHTTHRSESNEDPSEHGRAGHLQVKARCGECAELVLELGQFCVHGGLVEALQLLVGYVVHLVDVILFFPMAFLWDLDIFEVGHISLK